MSVIALDFAELMRTVLTMSLAGSAVALLLFVLKQFIKDRLPKIFQYYMWFAVLLVLILPLSKIVVLPELSFSSYQMTSLTPIHDMVLRNFYIVEEEHDRLVSFSQMENKQEIEARSHFLIAATIFSIVWPLGMIAYLSFNIMSYLRFTRKLIKTASLANTHEIEMLNQLPRNGYVPRLYRCPIAPTPMLIGVLRPMIVLPDKEYTNTQLHNILLHELTHLRRYDVVMKWLSVIAGSLHWFNPIIYLVRREISRACELACDEAVIKNLNANGKQNYGDTLIAVVAEHKTPKTVLSTTMCEEKKALKERLGAIMGYKKYSRKAIVLSSILLVIILCGTVVLGAASGKGNDVTQKYLVNVDGLTYGSAQNAISIESLPDLIHAGSIGNIDGKNIYLYTKDIFDAMPKTHEETQNGSYLDAVFTVYEEDGKTVAGSEDYFFAIQLLPAVVRSEYAIPAYPINIRGQTYGTMAGVGPSNPVEPDLIACIGIDGTEGYAYKTDLDGEQPSNPEEATEYMNRLEERYEEMSRTGEKYVRLIPLYAKDGVSVIGEFGITNGDMIKKGE